MVQIENIEFKDMVEIATTDRGKARIRVVCYFNSDVNENDTTCEVKAIHKYINTKHMLEDNKIPLVSDDYEVEVKNSAKGDLQVMVKGSENVAEKYHEEFKKGVRT